MPDRSSRAGSARRPQTRLAKRSVTQRARAALVPVAFGSGIRVGGIELSPAMSRAERQAVAFWVRRLPDGFAARLPRLKLAVAEQLGSARTSVVINKVPGTQDRSPKTHFHAASFIPQRYVVLRRSLFRRRIELGRIFYHELCHFLWPRLGNPLRQRYEAIVQREFRDGTRGELGYSAELRKEKLRAAGGSPGRKARLRRLWREYVCESFCDTTAYVLLGPERRVRHSEYTLSGAARERRCRWVASLCGLPSAASPDSTRSSLKSVAPGGNAR